MEKEKKKKFEYFSLLKKNGEEKISVVCCRWCKVNEPFNINNLQCDHPNPVGEAEADELDKSSQ